MKKSDVPIVFFDGYCNLCNTSVNVLLKMDKYKRLRYASLQGNTAAKLLQEDRYKLGDSIVLLDHSGISIQSTAILKICGYLPWPWKSGKYFKWIPLKWRDAVYNWIAQNRYQWFGKRDSCRMPTEEEKAVFLD